MSSIPPQRLRQANRGPVRPDGECVLYWMISARRLDWNFGLQRAVEWSRELGRSLRILEGLRVGYRWASDRLHRFALDGMAEHRRRLESTRIGYHAYVEPEEGHGSGLLEALAEEACVVVTDEFPCFFLPRMVKAAAEALPVRLEVVDSNGLLPLRAADRTYRSAYHFRRFLQKSLPRHLRDFPDPHPLRGDPLPQAPPLPDAVRERWPEAAPDLLEGGVAELAALSIDHSVPPVPHAGGAGAAGERLERFLEEDLDRYADERNDPDADRGSGLSPYLHWGHVSSHGVFRAVVDREGWTPGDLASGADGSREGWWGMSEGAEAFLDQLVTWRELGFVFNHRRDDYDRYTSLREWARETLEAHASDERPHLYDRSTFEEARTHDRLWNAAQRQLRREGTIHNYLRMLWGKKILEWTPDPRTALDVMIELNNRWAVDGRDPSSYSGIFWCLGRFDRGWPERPVFGKVRSMSSESTRRKVSVDGYLARFGDD